ncbi:hypothetical protein ACSDR0_36380 [Streptosporangium sp. G11]|uniref:hypothetical protein n=1 Tax=Streptosporangium sp. G11 TaxID=3436926 RepID=UPI003EB9836B
MTERTLIDEPHETEPHRLRTTCTPRGEKVFAVSACRTGSGAGAMSPAVRERVLLCEKAVQKVAARVRWGR